MVPFRPPVSVGSPGGSTILDRIVQGIRKSFDSLGKAFLAQPTPGTGGQILITGPDGLPVWSSTAGDTSGPEQVITDVLPFLQESVSVPTATTHTTTVALEASRHYWIKATATAFDPAQVVIFSETQLIRVSLNFAGLATHLVPDTVLHTYGAGLSLTAATSGGDLTLNVANASGFTYTVQLIAAFSSARTRS